MAIPLRDYDVSESADLAWEEVDCPLCGCDHWTPWMEAAEPVADADTALRFMLVRCQVCGLTFTNPRPTAESRIAFDLPEEILAKKKPDTIRSLFGRWSKSDPACTMLPPRGQRRLLAVGLEPGGNMQRWDEIGWRVFGLNVNDDASPRAEFDLGLPMFKGGFASSRIPAESFDAVTIWDALERVDAPLDLLHAAHQVLAPDGRLLLRTHNIDSWQFRQFGAAWHGLNLPTHVTHFTPATLRHMLAKAGFRILKLRMHRRRRWLQASARQCERLRDQPSTLLRWLQHPLAADLASWFAFLTRQSDCMMALAVKY